MRRPGTDLQSFVTHFFGKRAGALLRSAGNNRPEQNFMLYLSSEESDFFRPSRHFAKFEIGVNFAYVGIGTRDLLIWRQDITMYSFSTDSDVFSMPLSLKGKLGKAKLSRKHSQFHQICPIGTHSRFKAKLHQRVDFWPSEAIYC